MILNHPAIRSTFLAVALTILTSALIFVTAQIITYYSVTSTKDQLLGLYTQWHDLAAQIEKLNHQERQLDNSQDPKKQEQLVELYKSLSSLKVKREALIEQIEKEYVHFKQKDQLKDAQKNAVTFYSVITLSLITLLLGLIAKVTSFNIGLITSGLLSLILGYLLFYNSLPLIIILIIISAGLAALFALYYKPDHDNYTKLPPDVH